MLFFLHTFFQIKKEKKERKKMPMIIVHPGEPSPYLSGRDTYLRSLHFTAAMGTTPTYCASEEALEK
jgi:hypothetical protein